MYCKLFKIEASVFIVYDNYFKQQKWQPKKEEAMEKNHEKKIVRGLEIGAEYELRTYSSYGEIKLEQCIDAETQRVIFFNVHRKNLPDQGKLQSGQSRSLWRVRVDSLFDNDKTICAFISLPDPERISHEEFRVGNYETGMETTVMIGTNQEDQRNFILPDKRQEEFKVVFHLDEQDENQMKKLKSSKFGDKWLAKVVFLTPARDEGKDKKIVHAHVALIGEEPVSKVLFDEFRSGYWYSVSVTITNQGVKQLCKIFRAGKQVQFCLDQEAPEYKSSKEFLQTLKVGWNTQFTITRAVVRERDVVIYGYLNQAAKRQQLAS